MEAVIDDAKDTVIFPVATVSDVENEYDVVDEGNFLTVAYATLLSNA